MSETAQIETRTMRREELSVVLDWAASEGWNPGIEDAVHFFAADPDGFFVACKDGHPVASVSVVRAGPAHAFLGLYICRPEFRGRGYGTVVWQAGMAHAEGLSVGLDGVVAQQESYARSGFAYSHRTLRYAGRPRRPRGGRALGFTSADLGPALALDRRATGLERPGFLAGWLTAAPDRIVRRTEGGFRGYAVMRRCREGWKIGPVQAETSEDAGALVHALCADAAGAPVMLDVPETSAAGSAIAEDLGLDCVFETARMWRGSAPVARSGLEFGVCTLELG